MSNQKATEVLAVFRRVPDDAVAIGLTQAMWTALCNTYPGVSDDMIMAVWEYCQSRKMDPLKKPVHVVSMYVESKSGGGGRMMELVMPGIAELRTTAARTGLYAGMDEVQFGPIRKFKFAINAKGDDPEMLEAPEFARVTVHRMVGNKPMKWTHIEFFEEAVARTRAGLINSMWQKRPRGQLAKCAEAGALRKAFPEELGGVWSADEMIGRDEVVPHGKIDAHSVPDPVDVCASPPPAGDEDPADAQDERPGREPAASSFDDLPPDPDALSHEELLARKASDKAEARKAAEAENTPQRAEIEMRTANKLQDGGCPWVIDPSVPAGARGVLMNAIHRVGATEDALLRKIGANITIKNINEALAILKSW